MDLNGWRETKKALIAAGIEQSVVTPQPSEDEEVQFVTVETIDGTTSTGVLNALGVAGLLHYDGERDAVATSEPEFVFVTGETEFDPVLGDTRRLTLEDRNFSPQRGW